VKHKEWTGIIRPLLIRNNFRFQRTCFLYSSSVVLDRYSSSAETGFLCLRGSVVFGSNRVAEYALGSAGPVAVAKHLRQLGLARSKGDLDVRRLVTLMII
jgi:hypothetical protein